MIGYFFLAVGLLFVAYFGGIITGVGVGYFKGSEDAYDLIRQTFDDFTNGISEDQLKEMVDEGKFDRGYLVPKNEVDTDATVQTPEGSDREAP